MSNLSQMFDDFGFDQIADHAGDLFDYHPTGGGDEVPNLVGIVESRHSATEVEQLRYQHSVEVLNVAFKNDADTGIANPQHKDYITDAGASVAYYFHSINAINGTWRSMTFVRYADADRSGYRVGTERGYR